MEKHQYYVSWTGKRRIGLELEYEPGGGVFVLPTKPGGAVNFTEMLRKVARVAKKQRFESPEAVVITCVQRVY